MLDIKCIINIWCVCNVDGCISITFIATDLAASDARAQFVFVSAKFDGAHTHTHIWLAARWNFENLFSFTILGSHSFVINLMLVCFCWGVSSLTSTWAFCTVRIFWYRYNAITFWGGWLSIFGVQASGIDKWTQTPLQCGEKLRAKQTHLHCEQTGHDRHCWLW